VKMFGGNMLNLLGMPAKPPVAAQLADAHAAS
jgi:hypothetical protein